MIGDVLSFYAVINCLPKIWWTPKIYKISEWYTQVTHLFSFLQTMWLCIKPMRMLLPLRKLFSGRNYTENSWKLRSQQSVTFGLTFADELWRETKNEWRSCSKPLAVLNHMEKEAQILVWAVLILTQECTR